MSVRDPDALRLVYICNLEGSQDWRRLDALVAGGVTAIWLRAPHATGADLFHAARGLVRRAAPHGVETWIGDRADVAMSVGAEAVQVGHRSPPLRPLRGWFPRRIGASCHDADELAAAARRGADHAVLSPVYGVPDKGAPLGVQVLRRLVADASLPVVALGGIDAGNAKGVLETGVQGVACIRALRDAPDPLEAARHLRTLVDAAQPLAASRK